MNHHDAKMALLTSPDSCDSYGMVWPSGSQTAAAARVLSG